MLALSADLLLKCQYDFLKILFTQFEVELFEFSRKFDAIYNESKVNLFTAGGTCNYH